MEQNKTLLVIFSAALFLAAISSVGLWLFYSREDAAEPQAASAGGAEPQAADPIEWVRRSELPPLTPVETEPLADFVVQQYGETENAAPADNPAVSLPGAAPSAPPPPVVSLPPAVKKPAAPAPKPQVSSPAPRPAAPRTKTVTVKEYSIQVGAFSSRDRVEELNEVLKEKGLAGKVLYAEGPKLYRLRIGPYANQAEAEKFLGWVRSIDGFQDSMIFERMATRTVAN